MSMRSSDWWGRGAPIIPPNMSCSDFWLWYIWSAGVLLGFVLGLIL
jgi:hypothetical protein